MHKLLIEYMEERSNTPLSASDILLLKEAFVPKKLRKRQFLLQEGDVCRFIAFVVKGAIRQYTVDEKGNENILNLAIENWWMSDRESFYNQTPSIYNIDAWEDSELLLLPNTDGYYTRVNKIAAFKEMRIKLEDNNNRANQKRLYNAMNLSAEVRYEELTKIHPEFLQRFPQHMLASYLGIAEETLSRIRKKRK